MFTSTRTVNNPCRIKLDRHASVLSQKLLMTGPAHRQIVNSKFMDSYEDLLELTPKKDVLFIIRDWNAKVGSQETLGVTSKFGLGMRKEAGQRLIEFFKRTHWS